MATTTTIKSSLIALAVFLLGIGMTFLNEKDIAVGVIFFAITAIIVFFVLVMETPTKDLPVDLQSLKNDLDSATGISGLVTLITDYKAQIESIVGSGDVKAIFSMLGKYSPELQKIADAIITEIGKQTVPANQINWTSLITTAIASVK